MRSNVERQLRCSSCDEERRLLGVESESDCGWDPVRPEELIRPSRICTPAGRDVRDVDVKKSGGMCKIRVPRR